MTALVYHPDYNISFFGLEQLHPFDSCKYGRCWKALSETYGINLSKHHVHVDRPASEIELLLAHAPGYLKSLHDSKIVSAALEIPQLQKIPSWFLHWRVLRPMLWAVRGTILAAEAALQHGIAFNLSGGYHHAKPERGEGFCLFSDIAIAIRQLRLTGKLKPDDRIVYVDLDAHQGNGVSQQFLNDSSVFLFDMYNQDIYPFNERTLLERVDCKLPLSSTCNGEYYLRILREHLPGFLDSVGRSQSVALAIYNAGTDVYEHDPLGQMSVSAEAILERDMFVAGELRSRHIPVVILPSGGYTRESYRLIAKSIAQIIKDHGATP